MSCRRAICPIQSDLLPLPLPLIPILSLTVRTLLKPSGSALTALTNAVSLQMTSMVPYCEAVLQERLLRELTREHVDVLAALAEARSPPQVTGAWPTSLIQSSLIPCEAWPMSSQTCQAISPMVNPLT